jgi:hypothetical protein
VTSRKRFHILTLSNGIVSMSPARFASISVILRESMARIRRAVFPAAGLGTRFLPATKAQPKEMLVVVDKPIIQYAVEEAAASGLENLIIITGRGKHAIEDHFDVSFELERMLEDRGKSDLLSLVRAVSDMGWAMRSLWRATWCRESLSRSCSAMTSSMPKLPASGK